MPEIPDQHGELTDRTPVLKAIVGELAKKLTALQDDAAARFALVMNEWAAESNRAKTAAIESAYRAGREDAARDIEAVDVMTAGFCIGGCYDHDTHQEEWVAIARGDGVQPTEEPEADQPRTFHSSDEVQDNPEAQR